jgi:ubiquitin C-terminal hydrolase
LLPQISHGVLLTSYIAKVNIDDDRLDALKALLQVFKAMSDVTARIAVNSVKCRRFLHIKEMSFKNKSTENKLKQLSTLGPNLFVGKFFDLLHDSAENLRDAKETQHLRKRKIVDKQESKPSNLHVGLLPFVHKILYMTPYLGLILG